MTVLKYRLHDINLIIRSTAVYALLKGSLAAVYFGGDDLFHYLSRTSTVQEGGQSQWAIVLFTLAIAALFQPLRQRLQDLIDHRFYGRKYDAARTLQGFSARLRDEVDLEVLTQDLVSVVQETLQPTHASLWLRPPEAWR